MGWIIISTLFWGLDIFFIYISNVFPFPSLPFRNPPPSSPCLYESALPLTHSHPPALELTYTGALTTLRIEGISSHQCSIRPSSAT